MDYELLGINPTGWRIIPTPLPQKGIELRGKNQNEYHIISTPFPQKGIELLGINPIGCRTIITHKDRYIGFLLEGAFTIQAVAIRIEVDI